MVISTFWSEIIIYRYTQIQYEEEIESKQLPEDVIQSKQFINQLLTLNLTK